MDRELIKGHVHKIGDAIKLTNTGPLGKYDGSFADTGHIIGLTRDNGIPTYAVKFDCGATEMHLYSDEFKVVIIGEFK